MYNLLLQYIIHYWYAKTRDNPGNFKHFPADKIILQFAPGFILIWMKNISHNGPDGWVLSVRNYPNKIETSHDKLILNFVFF